MNRENTANRTEQAKPYYVNDYCWWEVYSGMRNEEATKEKQRKQRK